MSDLITVRQAHIEDLAALTRLLDDYRQFYGQSSQADRAHEFLHHRLSREQSVVFIAERGDQAVGFTQLYPSFSSVRLQATYILNDLYVIPSARRQGVAHRLLSAAQDFGLRVGAAHLSLSTAVDNTAAQALYEANDWTHDRAFIHYQLNL